MRLILTFLFASFICYSFAQQLTYDWNVVDLNQNPAGVKGQELLFKSGGKVYLVNESNGYSDLMEYDGNDVKLMLSHLKGDINYEGSLNTGPLLTLGGFSDTLYLYFLDPITSTLTELYEFEHNIKALKSFGDFAIFIDVHNRLLVTDGTPTGTTLIKQFDQIYSNEVLENTVSDGIIFRADNQLWKTDGTIAGTQAISAFSVGNFEEFVRSGEFVYFIKTENNPYRQVVWRTDGTDNGTTLLTAQNTFTSIDEIYPIDNGVLFFGETAEFGTEIWTCTENETASQLLIDIVAGPEQGVHDHIIHAFSFVTEDNMIFFRGGSANEGQIWKTDGTLENTEMVIDFTGLSGYEDFDVNTDRIGRSGAGKDFFFTESDGGENKLWSFDNVTQNVTFLVDMPVSGYRAAQSSGDQFYFTFFNGSQKLWTSDGTPAGTIELGSYAHEPKLSGTKDGHLFFTFYPDEQPFTSDGTVNGTGLLKEIKVDGFNGDFFSFEYNNVCHFVATDNINGLSFYTTDFTEAGTNFEADIYPNTFGSDIDFLTEAGGKLYFEREGTLWVSDGTITGSTNLDQPYNANSYYYGNTSTHLFFIHEDDLYATDGTPAGTSFLRPGQDFFNSFDYSNFDNNSAASMNDLLWFFYDDGDNGMELFKSDGTPIGTTAAFESVPGAETILRFNWSDPVFFDNRIFFSNKDDVFGTELWSSNGTLAGTSLFADLNPGSASTSPGELINIAGKFYFTKLNNQNYKLYSTDGTLAGLTDLADIRMNIEYGVGIIGNDIIFCSGKDLWKTDGTPQGTELIIENGEQPKQLRSFAGKVIFTLEDELHGIEPWITDGTIEGTQLLKDINPGDINSNPREFGIVQDQAFFNVQSTGFADQHLWVTNGTQASTLPSPFNLNPIFKPEFFHRINNRLYFLGGNFIYGDELHYLEFDYPQATVKGNVFNDQNGNGNHDNDEIGVLNLKILSGNGDEYTTFTNNQGDYELILPHGNYTIEPALNQCWQITSDSANYSITVDTLLIDSLDFALNNAAQSDTAQTAVNLFSATTRCGFTISHWLNISNTDCSTAFPVIKLELDPAVTFVDALIPPDSIDGQNLTWIIDSLESSQHFQIQLNLLMPGEEAVDDTIHHIVRSFADGLDSLVLRDEYDYYSVISCAIDPNDKRVMPDRQDLSEENYTLFDETLTYHIRFQNTGNDTAFTVRIVDQISSFLDIETLRPRTASHDYTVSNYPNNVVEFLFENILLPDSTTNESLSHGFVVFDISAKDDIDEFSEIENTAHIYFDFNSAVVTNTIVNTMVSTFDQDGDGFDIWDDCDDTNANINTTGTEIPYNGFDDDCDPATLDDDLDGDGFILEQDCDDNNLIINPDAVEIPYNDIDEDCDPATLDDDLDGDGFILEQDCDDNNLNINPDAVEIPYNGFDDDCDPATLDDDLDGDGFILEQDCDDNNLNINPDAVEIPNNDIDEDCDGEDLVVVSINHIKNSRIVIFPNPTNDQIQIQLPVIDKLYLNITDYSGRRMLEKQVSGNHTIVDLKLWPSGVYNIRLYDGNKMWTGYVVKVNR